MQLPDALTIPKIFIVLDIHKQSWSVSIQTDLFFHKTYSMPSIASDLYDYVANNFPTHEIHLVYEAGCCGFSTARYFLNLGWTVLVVNPADIILNRLFCITYFCIFVYAKIRNNLNECFRY